MSKPNSLKEHLESTREAQNQLFEMGSTVRHLYRDLDTVQSSAERGLVAGETAGQMFKEMCTELETAEAHLAQARKLAKEIEEGGLMREAKKQGRQSPQSQAYSPTQPTRDKLSDALEAMDSSELRRPIGEILMDAGLINQEQLDEALEVKSTAGRRHLGAILVDRGHVTEDVIARVLANQVKLPFVELASQNIEIRAVRCINRRLALRHFCIPLRMSDDRICLAVADPFDLLAIEDVEHATGREVDPVVATLMDLSEAIELHYPHTADSESAHN